jgi:hypothetical protein
MLNNRRGYDVFNNISVLSQRSVCLLIEETGVHTYLPKDTVNKEIPEYMTYTMYLPCINKETREYMTYICHALIKETPEYMTSHDVLSSIPFHERDSNSHLKW